MQESVKTEVKDLLTSWDEIATVIGRTPRTAQHWAKSRGLPVRYPHGKGLPIASRREILTWLADGNAAKQTIKQTPAPVIVTDIRCTEPREVPRCSRDADQPEQPVEGDAQAGGVKTKRRAGRQWIRWPLALGVTSLVVCLSLALNHRPAPPAPLSGEAAKLYHDSWVLLSQKHDAAWLEVVNMMNVALEQRPGHPDLHHLRGLAHRAMGQNERAIEDLKIAIAGRPHDGRAYYNRGAAYRAIGEYKKAIADQNQAIQFAPDDPSRDLFYQERGIALKKMGLARKDRSLLLRALADFDQVIELKPNNGWAWQERGSVWLALEEPVKALADFDRAEASLAPADRYWLYQDRANLKQHLGDYQGASADRQRAGLLTEKR